MLLQVCMSCGEFVIVTIVHCHIISTCIRPEANLLSYLEARVCDLGTRLMTCVVTIVSAGTIVGPHYLYMCIIS